MLLLHVWRVLLCNLLNYQLQSVVMRRMWGVRGLETCNGRWQINFLTTCCVLSQCGELFLCQTLWSHCGLKFSQLLRQHCDDGVLRTALDWTVCVRRQQTTLIWRTSRRQCQCQVPVCVCGLWQTVTVGRLTMDYHGKHATPSSLIISAQKL